MDHVNDWRQPASEWEDREEFFENILQAQLAARERQVMIAALSAALIDLGKSQADIIPGGDYAINIIEHAINSSDKNIWSDIPEIVARTALLKRVARIPKINQALNRLGYIPMVGSMSISAMQEIRKVLGEELPLVDATLDRVDDARAAVADDGKPIPFSLPVDPVQIHVVSEYLYDQDWTEIPNRSGPGTETIHHGFSPNYADLERASETLGLWTNAQADWAIRNRPLSWIQEKMPDAISAVQNTRPEWFRSNKKLVDAAKNTWGEAWLNVALGPGRTFTKVGGNRMFRDDLLDLNQAEFLYFPPGDPTVGTEFPDASHEWSREAGPIWDSAYGVPFLEIGQVAGELKDFRNAAGDVEYELGMLQSGFSYVRERVGDFAATTYGLTLSTETAEQALLAAGLSGTAVTQVFDIMRQTGFDPAAIAWSELEAAVHAWGEATDTEIDRVVGRLGELTRVQGGGGPGSAGSVGSRGSGGGSTGVDLDQLMSLARRVAVSRAEMDALPPEYVAHELGKLPDQLGRPGSDAEKLALLRLFFAGSAHAVSFGLGPSASSLGFTIPRFVSDGSIPGSHRALQPVVAHGGQHIVPHRATGNPIIIDMKMDREVLSQAVLGDLLRLQGREVTLGLS